MATDASIASAPSRPLPSVGTYLRQVGSLGKRSIAPALPALLFLAFFRFGMDLYLEVAGGGRTPLGHEDERARLVHAFMAISASLPIIVLVHMPFLPLQDSLLHGERASYLEGVRRVLERLLAFVLSGLAQLMILLGPVALVFGLMVAIVAPFPTPPREVVALLTLALLAPVMVWVLIAAIFLMFAMPSLILDGYGPIQAIRRSVGMVARRFFGLLGRLLVWMFVLFAVMVVAMMPAFGLQGIAPLTGGAAVALRIAAILWMSAVAALTVPFSVASMIVLYRALAPRGGEEIGQEAAGAPGIAPSAPAPALPRPDGTEQPTPYIFE
jgi:hypothetical protein